MHSVTEILAFDRASGRTIDHDGRLHVKLSNISKANICPYMGAEIPKYKELGLQSDKVYQLFRDPDELRKGLPTFNNLPVLRRHIPVSADNHRPDDVIGSTGTDAAFDGTYLTNSLVIWASEDIAGITERLKHELSSAYHYDADMTPGEFRGAKYDGVMRNIRGNHVAVVEAGRAGTDVVVGDEKPSFLKRNKIAIVSPSRNMQTANRVAGQARKDVAMDAFSLVVRSHLAPYLAERLTSGSKIAMDAVLADVNPKKWNTSKKRIVRNLTEKVKGKLAQDADIGDVLDLLDRLDEVAEEVADKVDDTTDAAEGVRDNPDSDDATSDDGPDEDDEDANDAAGLPAAAVEFLSGKISDEELAKLKEICSPAPAEDASANAAAGASGAKPVKAPPAKGKSAKDAKTAKDKAKDAKPAKDAKKTAKDDAGGQTGSHGAGKDDDDDDTANDRKRKPAMDAAIAAAVKEAERNTIARLNACREAEKTVRPYVGEIDTMAMDSAGKIYEYALEQLGFDTEGVTDPKALRLILKAQPVPGSGTPKMAADAAIKAPDADFLKKYPHALRLKH